jgi:AdoMet-dependent heme synthase
MAHETFVHDQRPLRIYWEITRACDLACRHCRAAAVPDSDPDELTHREALHLIARLAEFGEPMPHLVFTGGDPLKRDDLFELIAAARRTGFPVSVAPSATPRLTSDALVAMRNAGVAAISLSLDAATPLRHDAIRGIDGTFDRTVAAAGVAADIGLPFQINTLVCRDTVDELPWIYERARAIGAARWSLFFLVTTGRGRVLQPISPARAEAVLNWAAELSAIRRPEDPVITTTEAPQARRVAIQRQSDNHSSTGRPPRSHAGNGIRDGNGIMFISHTGDISPSGFLEIRLGNVRFDDPVATYRHSWMFRELREPDRFYGRCGACEFHWVCGGSRARAYAATGNALGEDPLCPYVPRSARPALSPTRAQPDAADASGAARCDAPPRQRLALFAAAARVRTSENAP